MSKSRYQFRSHQAELKRLLGELKSETILFEELTSNKKLREVKKLKEDLAEYQKQLKRERDTEAEILAALLMGEEPKERGNNAFATVSKQATRQMTQKKIKSARAQLTKKYSDKYIALARKYHEYELAVIKSGEKVKDLQKEVRKRFQLIKAGKKLDRVANGNLMAFIKSSGRGKGLLMVNNTNTNRSTHRSPGAQMNSPTYERFVASVMTGFEDSPKESRKSREEFESTVKTLPRKSKKSRGSSSLFSTGGGRGRNSKRNSKRNSEKNSKKNSKRNSERNN